MVRKEMKDIFKNQKWTSRDEKLQFLKFYQIEITD